MTLLDKVFGRHHAERPGYTTVLMDEPDRRRPLNEYDLFLSRTCQRCYLTIHHDTLFPWRGCRA